MHNTTTITRLFQAVLACLTTHTSVHNILVILLVLVSIVVPHIKHGCDL